MDILTLDFESYYDKVFGLKKLTMEEYIRDPRFEVLLCGVKMNDSPTRVFEASLLPELFKRIDWSNTALLCHNTQFDGLILSEKYNVVPAFYLDTLFMSNALQDEVEVGGSLAKLVKKYNIGEKGKEVLDAIGKHKADFTEEEWEQYKGYCANDVELTYKLFQKLKGNFPVSELKLIDMTIRMYTVPELILDTSLLNSSLDEEEQEIAGLLSSLGVTEEDLASNEKFAEIVRSAGYEPPTKYSAKQDKDVYAFAKNDAGFQQLMQTDHKAELLCKARMKVKSTQKRTRSKRLVDIGTRGTLPVPLKYWGAKKTGRFSGTESINMQNLTRGSDLRNAIMAPEGKQIIVSDLSQIEPRVLAWLAGDTQLLEMLKTEDPYALFGAKMFGIPDLNKKDHPELRQAAKSALLGCGYGLGYPSFSSQLMTGFMGAPPVLYDWEFAQKIGVPPGKAEQNAKDNWFLHRVKDVIYTCTFDEFIMHATVTEHIINKYRASSPAITKFWDTCEQLIQFMYEGKEVTYKNIRTGKECIWLPNGMRLFYPGLRKEGNDWLYGKNDKLYGSKLTENITQAEARIVMTDGMLRIHERYPIKLTVHDESVSLADLDDTEAPDWIHEQMIVEPPYMPGIPLAADTSTGIRYGDAK